MRWNTSKKLLLCFLIVNVSRILGNLLENFSTLSQIIIIFFSSFAIIVCFKNLVTLHKKRLFKIPTQKNDTIEDFEVDEPIMKTFSRIINQVMYDIRHDIQLSKIIYQITIILFLSTLFIGISRLVKISLVSYLLIIILMLIYLVWSILTFFFLMGGKKRKALLFFFAYGLFAEFIGRIAMEDIWEAVILLSAFLLILFSEEGISFLLKKIIRKEDISEKLQLKLIEFRIRATYGLLAVFIGIKLSDYMMKIIKGSDFLNQYNFFSLGNLRSIIPFFVFLFFVFIEFVALKTDAFRAIKKYLKDNIEETG